MGRPKRLLLVSLRVVVSHAIFETYRSYDSKGWAIIEVRISLILIRSPSRDVYLRKYAVSKSLRSERLALYEYISDCFAIQDGTIDYAFEELSKMETRDLFGCIE